MKKWIPAAVLTIAAAALAGAALFTVGLEPVEDRSAALSGQIRAQEQENQIMYSTVQARETEATAAEAEAERLQALQAQVEQDRERYDGLLAKWKTGQELIEQLQARQTAPEGLMLPPNYDRKALEYLQGEAQIGSAVSGLFGAITAFVGSNTANMIQQSVGDVLSEISGMTDELNAVVQQGEKALALYGSVGGVAGQLLDSEARGETAELQMKLLEAFSRGEEQSKAESEMLRSAAQAAVTLECFAPLYDLYLSGADGNGSYVSQLNDNAARFRALVEKSGADPYVLLGETEVNAIYQKMMNWHQRIGLALQESAMWYDVNTMQSSYVDVGRRFLVTYRNKVDDLIAATETKDGLLAYYGFDQGGEPLCFLRGEGYIFFDWLADDGTVLASSGDYSADQMTLIYRFACGMRDTRNGFGKELYQQYQRVY